MYDAPADPAWGGTRPPTARELNEPSMAVDEEAPLGRRVPEPSEAPPAARVVPVARTYSVVEKAMGIVALPVALVLYVVAVSGRDYNGGRDEGDDAVTTIRKWFLYGMSPFCLLFRLLQLVMLPFAAMGLGLDLAFGCMRQVSRDKTTVLFNRELSILGHAGVTFEFVLRGLTFPFFLAGIAWNYAQHFAFGSSESVVVVDRALVDLEGYSPWIMICANMHVGYLSLSGLFTPIIVLVAPFAFFSTVIVHLHLLPWLNAGQVPGSMQFNQMLVVGLGYFVGLPFATMGAGFIKVRHSLDTSLDMEPEFVLSQYSFSDTIVQFCVMILRLLCVVFVVVSLLMDAVAHLFVNNIMPRTYWSHVAAGLTRPCFLPLFFASVAMDNAARMVGGVSVQRRNFWQHTANGIIRLLFIPLALLGAMSLLVTDDVAAALGLAPVNLAHWQRSKTTGRLEAQYFDLVFEGVLVPVRALVFPFAAGSFLGQYLSGFKAELDYWGHARRGATRSVLSLLAFLGWISNHWAPSAAAALGLKYSEKSEDSEFMSLVAQGMLLPLRGLVLLAVLFSLLHDAVERWLFSNPDVRPRKDFWAHAIVGVPLFVELILAVILSPLLALFTALPALRAAGAVVFLVDSSKLVEAWKTPRPAERFSRHMFWGRIAEALLELVLLPVRLVALPFVLLAGWVGWGLHQLCCHGDYHLLQIFCDKGDDSDNGNFWSHLIGGVNLLFVLPFTLIGMLVEAALFVLLGGHHLDDRCLTVLANSLRNLSGYAESGLVVCGRSLVVPLYLVDKLVTTDLLQGSQHYSSGRSGEYWPRVGWGVPETLALPLIFLAAIMGALVWATDACGGVFTVEQTDRSLLGLAITAVSVVRKVCRPLWNWAIESFMHAIREAWYCLNAWLIDPVVTLLRRVLDLCWSAIKTVINAMGAALSWVINAVAAVLG